MTPDLEALEAENNQRLMDLMAGKVGLPVQLPPGALETMRLTVYVEHLLDALSPTCLNDAKRQYATKLSDMLGQIEEQSRQARITHGTGIFDPTR